MASTTAKGFPYPASTDAVDVPYDIGQLATTIDTKLTTTAVASTIPYREANGTITVGTPTADSHAATKAYVDAISAGLNAHNNVRVASTVAITGTYTPGTTGADGGTGVGATFVYVAATYPTIDGATLVATDRVLLKDQAAALQNGLYTVTTVSTNITLTRATDYDGTAAGEVNAGDFVFVSAGTANINKGFVMNTVGTSTNPVGAIKIGTDVINWTLFSSPSVANITLDNATATSVYPLWNPSNSNGTAASNNVTTALSFVPSTGTLTTTLLSLTGATLSINAASPTISTNATTSTGAIFNTNLTTGLNIGQAVTGTINIGSATGTVAFGNIITAPTINSTTATTAMLIGNTNTTGAITIGGVVGSTAAVGTISIGNNAGIAGGTKTINLGTGATAGTTTVTIGSAVGSTTNILGTAQVGGSAILTAASTTSALTSFGTSPTLTTPKIDTLQSVTGAAAAANIYNDITTGSITIGTILGSTAAPGTVTIANNAGIAGGTKAINIGTGATAGNTTISLGAALATSTTTINGQFVQGTNTVTPVGGTTPIPLNQYGTCTITPTAAVVFTANTTSAVSGARATLVILTSGTVSFTITFSTGFLTGTTTLVTGTTTGKYFILQYLYNGTNWMELSRTAAL